MLPQHQGSPNYGPRATSGRPCEVTEAETSWRPLLCCAAEDETLPQRGHCGAHPARRATTAGDGGVKRETARSLSSFQ